MKFVKRKNEYAATFQMGLCFVVVHRNILKLNVIKLVIFKIVC